MQSCYPLKLDGQVPVGGLKTKVKPGYPYRIKDGLVQNVLAKIPVEPEEFIS